MRKEAHLKDTPDRKTKIDKKELIRKLVLLALLAAALLFLFMHRDAFRNDVGEVLEPDRPVAENVTVSLLGDHVIEQPMTARSDSIGTIGILINNAEMGKAEGTVTLELIDSAGNVVGSTDIDASLIRTNDYTKFMLGGDSEVLNANRITTTHDRSDRNGNTSLDKGARYTLRITAKDIKSEGAFDLALLKYAEDSSGEAGMTLDAETMDQTAINAYVVNRVYSNKTNLIFAVLFLITLIFILLPFRRIDEKAAKLTGREWFSLSKWVSRAMFIISPVVTYFIIEKYVDIGLRGFLKALTDSKGIGFLNLMIIGLIWILIYTISGNTRFTAMLTVLIGSVFGFTNYALILFRDTPLIATDFTQAGTALQVADTYQLTFTKYCLWAVVFTALWCIACYAPPKYRRLPLAKRFIPLAALLIWSGVFYYTFFVSTYIEDHELRVSSFKPVGSYKKNGCALSFVITVRNSIVKKPKDYSVEEIEAIAGKYQSDEASSSKAAGGKTPNIIVVMNESFSDLAVLGELETNQDYIPFYRSLKENTVKGWMDSSVFGGSTANSEFEFLTGFSMKFLPFQSVPFRSVISEQTPSLTGDLKSMGYGGNIAFHPGLRNSYSRDKVYPLLGFDKHISYEDLEDPDTVRDYVSDKGDYETVESEFENFRKDNPDSPFYMFNVTIQNHAGYTYNVGVVDAGVEILSPDSQYEQAGQFLNLMKKSDEALEQLITYFSNVDEDTIIVFYGDHQPRLETGFYHSLRVQHEGLDDFEWSYMKHKVPFMIWANYDIEESEGTEMSANYMAPYLKSLLGMPMTGFDKYLLDLYKEYPVISAICYKDASGEVHVPEESADGDERISEYERIQYNGLIDTKNRVEEFFTLKQ